MPGRSQRQINRRGRRPSLRVAARKTGLIQRNVRSVLTELEDLESRLVRLESLLDAHRQAERERAQRRSRVSQRGIRGKGANVRDLAFQVLARRRKPMEIQEISRNVLRIKKGNPGANFTQNLGAALARDRRFSRVGRGVYTVKR
jgi:hypothetical protein